MSADDWYKKYKYSLSENFRPPSYSINYRRSILDREPAYQTRSTLLPTRLRNYQPNLSSLRRSCDYTSGFVSRYTVSTNLPQRTEPRYSCIYGSSTLSTGFPSTTRASSTEIINRRNESSVNKPFSLECSKRSYSNKSYANSYEMSALNRRYSSQRIQDSKFTSEENVDNKVLRLNYSRYQDSSKNDLLTDCAKQASINDLQNCSTKYELSLNAVDSKTSLYENGVKKLESKLQDQEFLYEKNQDVELANKGLKPYTKAEDDKIIVKRRKTRIPIYLPTETLWEIVQFLSFADCPKVAPISRTFAQLVEPRMKLRVQLLMEQIDRTKKQLDETNSQIADRKEQISLLNGHIYAMNGRLGDMNGRLMAMNSQIVQSHQRIDELLIRLRNIQLPARAADPANQANANNLNENAQQYESDNDSEIEENSIQ